MSTNKPDIIARYEEVQVIPDKPYFFGINAGVIAFLHCENAQRIRLEYTDGSLIPSLWATDGVGVSPHLDTYTNACYVKAHVPTTIGIVRLFVEVPV